jgi:transcriptional regulator with GAF, ATPase, and Fis domain
MATGATWFLACGCGDAMATEVRRQLAVEGVDLSAFGDASDGSPYGIVCFDRISSELLSILGAAQLRLARVLAVATSMAESALPVWRLLQAGASDALIWDKRGVTAKQISAKLKRWSQVDDLLDAAYAEGLVVGDSPAWRGLVRKVVEAAHFTTSPILITGESGTGKELLARLVSAVTPALDGAAPRRDLVTVDCGTLVPELSGSEFFGHERGAFTGAHTMREGAFALADGATLLLDEIGDIPRPLQAQILRSIQERTYKRLGSNVWQTTNFRLVAATNRDLEDLVERGDFRLDLYYRIAGSVFCTPPLRDRREDILPLAAYFLQKTLSKPAPEFDGHVRKYLLNRSYPGNVRELRQLIERIGIRYPGTGPVTAGDLPEEDRPDPEDDGGAWPDDRFVQSIAQAVNLRISLKEISQMTAKTAVRLAVNVENGNLQRAALRLGITSRAMQMRRAAGDLELRLLPAPAHHPIGNGMLPLINGRRH